MRGLNGFYDEMFSPTSGQSGPMAASGLGGIWDSVKNEFNSLVDAVEGNPPPGSLQYDANQNAATGQPPPGIVALQDAWQNDIVTPAENFIQNDIVQPVKSGASTMLFIVVGLALLYVAAETERR